MNKRKFLNTIKYLVGPNVAKSRLARWIRRKLSLPSLLANSVGDWRYPFLAFGWRIATFLTRPRKVSVGDVSFTLPCRNWVTHFRWYLFETKEPEVRHYIDRYVKSNDVLFDIGANVGVFSVYAGKKNIKVYCFEPEYSNLSLLKENVLTNRLADRVNIYSVALSDFVGISTLHLQSIEEGAAAHTESQTPITTTDEGYPVVHAEGIFAVTLDYICEQLRVSPNCVKIDTDGNETKILQGATKTLRNPSLRSLVIEMPVPAMERATCEEILKQNGFKPVWVQRDKTRNEIWERAQT